MAPSIALGSVFGRIGCLLNGCCYGRACDLPWAISFPPGNPLGSPTTNPKPYTTVLAPADDTVTVQYQWRKGSDQECCPTGNGTVKYQIGPDGKLKALSAIPHQ